MTTKVAFSQRVARARELGTYERMRGPLQTLISMGFTRKQVAVARGISVATLDTALAALELTMESKYNPCAGESNPEPLPVQRARERALVIAVRKKYGPIGRGFSTA